MTHKRIIHPRFHYDFGYNSLNQSAIQLTRWPVLQKVRRHSEELRLLVSKEFQVLFHLPNRDTFHLSLTVLVRYRSPNLFSLTRWSSQIPTRFLVSRGTWELHPGGFLPFAYRTVTFYGTPFQDDSTRQKLCNLPTQSALESGETPRHRPYNACGL